jgi:hypothetical protein
MMLKYNINKHIDLQIFRHSLSQVLVEQHGSGIPYPVHGCASVEPSPLRLRHFLEHILAIRKTKPQRKCVGKVENFFMK